MRALQHDRMRAAVLVLAVLVRLLAAQELLGAQDTMVRRELVGVSYEKFFPPFPDERSDCHSDDPPCTVGTRWMAEEFPIMITSYTPPPRGYTGKAVAEAIAEGDITYLLPEGYVIDFTGGLQIEPKRYVSPDRYVGEGGDTFFPDMQVTIVVNATGFDPAHVAVLPGATVTWDLQTYETVNVRSNDDGKTFSSGPLNRIWSPKFSMVFKDEGDYYYRNVEVPEWRDMYNGKITVAPYNCSLYTTCTTCLLYERCLWCPGNGTCHERNLTTNIPLDTGPVTAVEPQEEYEAARYMFGYNTRAAKFQFDWYPWPPFRRNPKPIPDRLIPTYFDPIASDSCSAYMRTRDAAMCEDAFVEGPRERVHGIETAGRPQLDDWFKCYEHVSNTRVREFLFLCGPVSAEDYLPPECAIRNLTVVECGEAGYMRGKLNASGISNLVGRPDSGYAAIACAKCNSRGEMRSEPFSKLCDRALVLAACQRYEDATAQRLCNYCGGETQGSVMPQRGIDKSCSYYRGTCMGSVEKRIRGIVPPNLDIVGQTMYGGLRYCKEATTYTSVKHYYSDADIMQVGQTCREGTTPAFEHWDWTRQRDHELTEKNEWGNRCADPDNEATCPLARHCIHPNMCYADTPDWMDIHELVRYLGLDRLRRFADNTNCNAYFESPAQEMAYRNQQQQLGNTETIIPCTFEEHAVVLFPTNAADFANWPFLSQDYLDRYTHVTWATEGRARPPPPLPPPPAYENHQWGVGN